MVKIGSNRPSSLLEKSENKQFESSSKLIQITQNESEKSITDEYLIKLIKEKKIDPKKLLALSKMLSLMSQTQTHKTTNKGNSIKDILSNDTFYEEETESSLSFRLPLFKVDNSIIKKKENYIDDLVKEKMLGIDAVRQMQDDIHKQIVEMQDDQIVQSREALITKDQRFFQKVYANMNFGCLRAVDKAYENRNISDKIYLKKKIVEDVRDENKYSGQSVEFYREDKINDGQQMVAAKKEIETDAKIKSENELAQLKEQIMEERMRRMHFREMRKRDISLAIDFSKQHLSVSKALQRHEFVTLRDKISKDNEDHILKLRHDNEKQKDLVKKYLEQRNVLRVIQTKNDKSIIENRLRDEHDFEDYHSKNRVTYLRVLETKSRTRTGLKECRENNPTRIINLSSSFKPTSGSQISIITDDKPRSRTILHKDEFSKDTTSIKEKNQSKETTQLMTESPKVNETPQLAETPKITEPPHVNSMPLINES